MRPIILREYTDYSLDDSPVRTEGNQEKLADLEDFTTEEPDIPEDTGDAELFPDEPVEEVEEPVLSELLSLEDALKRIPGSLRTEMEDLLRAEFREVRFWRQGNRH